MGLSLPRHPFALMRPNLPRQKIATCADVLAARGGTWLTVAGLVPVRQMRAPVTERSNQSGEKLT
jgi:error-prone DNA polymerase